MSKIAIHAYAPLLNRLSFETKVEIYARAKQMLNSPQVTQDIKELFFVLAADNDVRHWAKTQPK